MKYQGVKYSLRWFNLTSPKLDLTETIFPLCVPKIPKILGKKWPLKMKGTSCGKTVATFMKDYWNTYYQTSGSVMKNVNLFQSER